MKQSNKTNKKMFTLFHDSHFLLLGVIDYLYLRISYLSSLLFFSFLLYSKDNQLKSHHERWMLDAAGRGGYANELMGGQTSWFCVGVRGLFSCGSAGFCTDGRESGAVSASFFFGVENREETKIDKQSPSLCSL